MFYFGAAFMYIGLLGFMIQTLRRLDKLENKIAELENKQ